jgi:arylsulfatase A-like enzyme
MKKNAAFFVAGLSAGVGMVYGAEQSQESGMNVLFIIADDLTASVLGCYGSEQCRTPNIDKLAGESVRYTRAFCQFPVCGPSRASLMSGYYPNATKVFGYVSGRKAIGPNRETWAQHFKNNGYYTARVSKIFHMAVPRDIERGSNGTDDPASWVERFNSQGLEWLSPGEAELVQNNPNGKIKRRDGNVMTIVKADGDDFSQPDGKTARKACELLHKHAGKPFFLAVGFVRPHVPFVAPKKYFNAYPWQSIKLPPKVENDWDDIPKAGINYRTTPGMQMDLEDIKKARAAYFACVSYMDAQVGRVLDALEKEGLSDKTIVIFTSDHGYFLGEHDFWMKVGLMDPSSHVPLMIRVPGKKPSVCNSFVELLDLYPTISHLCGLKIPAHIQGKNIAQTLDDPSYSVRDAIFCVNKHSFLIRTKKWAYIQHGENGRLGAELYDMDKDPNQFTNLAQNPEYRNVVQSFKKRLRDRLKSVRNNDLGLTYGRSNEHQKTKKH